MTSPIGSIVRWAHRRRRLVVGAVLCVLLVSVVGLRRLSFDADVLSLLPRDSRIIQSFRDYLARFGSLEGLYVVFTSPDGHPISEYEEDISTWVDRLRAAPEIGRVDPGVVDRTRDFAWLADRQLLALHGRALDEALERLRPRGMMDAVAARRELLTVPSPDVAALIRQDPAGLFDLLRDSLSGAQAGFGVGVSGGGYVTPDGHSRLIIARPKRPPYDAEFSRALDARLREIEASIGRAAAPGPQPAGGNDVADDAEPRPPLAVEFAGGHRIAVETEAFVRRETFLNTVESLALILPLLFLVFRSAWLVVVGSLPSALSLVVVLGALGFSGATLSAAATGAAAMIFGLGVDGVVLLYVAHQLAVAADPAADGPAALAGPSGSMLLGMWTTAATFYGLMFVDFPSLQQLGRLIGHSMFVCGILTLVMVPALLPRRSARRPARALLLMPRLARWIERHRRPILVASAVLTCGLGFFATRIQINPTLERLRSVTDAARLEMKIGAAFGLPSDVYVVIAEGPQLEPLLETNERLAERLAAAVPGLAFQPPTRLLPSAAAQARTIAQIDRAQLSPATVRAALEQARVASGFAPGAFDPFSERVPRLLDPAERLSYDGYVAHGLTDLIDRFVVHDGDRWTLATYVFPANGEQSSRLQAVVDAVDPAQTLTGLAVVNQELARNFVPQFIKGLAIGTLIVIALVVAAFRQWRLTMYALLPTALGLVWTAGALAAAGVELDLFAVFAVVTFVGIGVDYGVHLVHRYQERGDAVRATAELAPVILVAAAITLLGYGTLITSSYPPLRSIGVVSAVSVVALALASVVLLPALLVTPSQDAPR
jgi:predicted RND superfamily exporter protein